MYLARAGAQKEMTMAEQPKLECEEAFSAISDGLAALRLFWEALDSSPSQLDQDAIARALHVTLHPMEKAAKDLEEKLGLGSDDKGGAHA